MANTVTSTPLTLIIGPLGAGKTTFVRQLLTYKPAEARWGVLVNDFGTMSLDAQALSLQGVVVESLSGGCVCCGLQGMVTQALQRLVQADVERILLEPSGVAEARALYLALRKLPFIQLLPTIAVIPVGALLAERKSSVLRAQLALAQLIWVSHSQGLTREQQREIGEQLGMLYPAKMDWQVELKAEVMKEWLALLSINEAQARTVKADVQRYFSVAEIQQEQHQHAGLQQSGWRFPLLHQWSRPCLQKQLACLMMQSVLRVKGLLRTGPAHWMQVDWTPYSGWHWQESDYAGDSRFEVIERNASIDWPSLLSNCIYQKDVLA